MGSKNVGCIHISDKVTLKDVTTNNGECVYLYLGTLINNKKPSIIEHAGEHVVCLPIRRYTSSTSGWFKDREDEIREVYKVLSKITDLCDEGKYVVVDRATYENITEALISSPKILKSVVQTFKSLRP